jgi:hypothetical protein
MGILITTAALLLVIYYSARKILSDELSLVLAPLGKHDRPNKNDSVDLNEYFIDNNGTLYSFNSLTWERNKSKGKDVLICSNETTNKDGHVINTLRDSKGIKYTITRMNMDFDKLRLLNGTLKLKALANGPRHLKVIEKEFKGSKNVV